MIRVFCVNGPTAGQTLNRPEGHTGAPSAVIVQHRDGFYLARETDQLAGLWPAYWITVPDREMVTA